MFRRFFGKKNVVPLVVLEGKIQAKGGDSLAWRKTIPRLEAAFQRFPQSPVVGLLVNSPGGAPGQSSWLYNSILSLKTKHNKKVVAFVPDVAASGGYYVAAAADEIVIDPNAIVGSIGVISQWFGATGLMDKIGVKPRIYTAGKSKAFMSPFKEEPTEEELTLLKNVQTEIHRNFVNVVKESRGSKLKESEELLFSGQIFVGQQAVSVGLVDALGNPTSWLQQHYPAMKYQLMASRGGLFSQLTSSLLNVQRQLLDNVEDSTRFSIKT